MKIIFIAIMLLIISCNKVENNRAVYKFVPQQDITTYELALILNGWVAGDLMPPEGTERHFIIEEIK